MFVVFCHYSEKKNPSSYIAFFFLENLNGVGVGVVISFLIIFNISDLMSIRVLTEKKL